MMIPNFLKVIFDFLFIVALSITLLIGYEMFVDKDTKVVIDTSRIMRFFR